MQGVFHRLGSLGPFLGRPPPQSPFLPLVRAFASAGSPRVSPLAARRRTPATGEVPARMRKAVARRDGLKTVDRLPPSVLEATAPYHSRIVYDPRVYTPRGNPAEHTFQDAGLYYSLGADERAVERVFPGGLPGDIDVEFKVVGAAALLVRPAGVVLVQHLEHWRQTDGRRLAASGARVADVDCGAPYAPRELHMPVTRAESLGLAEGATAAPAAGGGAAGAAAAAAAPPPPALAHPHALPFQPVRVLTGQRGIGKTGLLTYAVHYARANGWLSVLVPDGFAVSRLGKVMAPSVSAPGNFDQHDWALALLNDVARANDAALRALPQRRKYASHRYLPAELDRAVTAQRKELRLAEARERDELKARADAEGREWDPASFTSKYHDESDTSRDRAGFTLADLVAWGIKHPASATDTFVALLGELRLVTEFPVLVAVDGINHLYEQGPHAFDDKDVPPERLTLQAALQCLGPSGFKEEFAMARGVWLCAVSHKHSLNVGAMFAEKADVKNRYRLPVPRLTRQEVCSQLRHYRDTGKLFMLEGVKEIDPFLVEYFRTMSGGVPGEMLKCSLFVPERRRN